MIRIEKAIDCCGCSACEQACPVHAITMHRDKIGFDYPTINEKQCINCNACDKVCPIKNEFSVRTPEHIYAVKNKNKEERIVSSSGGVFSILARDVLRKGGAVYGAAFDSNWSVHHIRIETENELYRLQGSKYVQSKIGAVFKKVQKDVQEDRPVLFSGTPCQVAGLLRFLKKEYPNLTTVDVACHGVPNPRIWEDYLKDISTNKKIENITFKDKSTGWKWDSYSFSLTLSGKRYTKNVWKQPYMQLFLHDFILRPSCHACHFRNGKSGADMTIADYWGIERIIPSFFDDIGVSALLSWNSPIHNSITLHATYLETNFEDFCQGNSALKNSPHKYFYSKLFYLMYDKFHFPLNASIKIGLAIKYCHTSLGKITNYSLFFIKKIFFIHKWQK